MKKVFKGSTFISWFLENRPVKRVLFPTRDSFHIINLDEIEGNSYYLMTYRPDNEIVLEKVELMI